MDCSPSAPAPYEHNYNAPRSGHYQQPKADGYGYDGPDLVATITPDLAGDIDARNGWVEPDEAAPGAHDAAVESASDILSPLLAWLGMGDTLESIGRRAVVLIQFVRPEHFDGVGLRELGERFGGTKQSFGKYNSELRVLTRNMLSRRHGMRHVTTSNNSWSVAQRKRHRAKGHQTHHGNRVDSIRAALKVKPILAKIDAQKACKPAKEA